MRKSERKNARRLWAIGSREADRRKESSVGGTPVPEAWVGESVDLVFISGASTEYISGRLEEVNDRGMPLSSLTHVGQPKQLLFYPWSAIIQLSLPAER